jgi:hypothetical protein
MYIDDDINTREQAEHARQLFAAVVLAALDDAIADNKKFGTGIMQIERWVHSRDGTEVLALAGIDSNKRVAAEMASFVAKGVPTSVALTST